MKLELIKALLEIIDDNYGANVESGVNVRYIGQGQYDIIVKDRDKLVALIEREVSEAS